MKKRRYRLLSGLRNVADKTIKEIDMKDNLILVDKDKFETLVYDEVQKMRHILYDINMDNYTLLPSHIKKGISHGKPIVQIPVDEWEKYNEIMFQCIDDGNIAREMLEIMRPVYVEYHEAYEKAHNISFDERMKMFITSYDSDEFERVRDKFEDEFYRDIDDGEFELS